jgi:hypothetical protein
METLSWDNKKILAMFKRTRLHPGNGEGLTAARARWSLLRIWNLRATKRLCTEQQHGKCAKCGERIGRGAHCHHKRPVKEIAADPRLSFERALEEYLSPAGCEAVCARCHKRIEAKRRRVAKLLTSVFRNLQIQNPPKKPNAKSSALASGMLLRGGHRW